MSSKVGVLALQGAFSEHAACLAAAGSEVSEIRLAADLARVDGLIIPGGESTSISLLMLEYGLFDPLRELALSGFPIWGTCAGLIMLSRLSNGSYPKTLGVLDLRVDRNAYGRQIDSFESELDVPVLGSKPFRGIFIRAPKITSVGPDIEILCQQPENGPVAARQGNLLVCSFHPELSGDLRFHVYFLDIVKNAKFRN